MHWFDQLCQEWERKHPGSKMSIRRLAGRAEVDKGTVERFKKGLGVNRKNLEKLANLFDMTPGELLDRQKRDGS